MTTHRWKGRWAAQPAAGRLAEWEYANDPQPKRFDVNQLYACHKWS